LNEYVEQGTGPVFGFPPICYSPPNELKKDYQDNEFMNVLMNNFGSKNQPSVRQMLDAKKENDVLISNLSQRFMSGGRRRDQYGNYI
jgi:hypothetical protein